MFDQSLPSHSEEDRAYNAAKAGNFDVLRQCVEQSKKLQSKQLTAGPGQSKTVAWHSLPGITNVPDARGKTLLSLACEGQAETCVRYLLKQGALVNVAREEDGNTPLHICASLGAAQLAKLLIEHRSDVATLNSHGKY